LQCFKFKKLKTVLPLPKDLNACVVAVTLQMVPTAVILQFYTVEKNIFMLRQSRIRWRLDLYIW